MRTDGQTDTLYEVHNHSSQFCECV